MSVLMYACTQTRAHARTLKFNTHTHTLIQVSCSCVPTYYSLGNICVVCSHLWCACIVLVVLCSCLDSNWNY